MTVDLQHCTDGENPLTFPSGYQIVINGDTLYDTLIGSGTDENGNFQEYLYHAGSGRYVNVTCQIRLIMTIDMIEPAYWLFSNHGSGEITY